jgi:hypothetical protein
VSRIIALMSSLGLAAIAPAFAHHGFGTFDRDSHIAVTGIVTGVDFVNPHAWVYFDVTEADGQPSAWRCEMRAATVLRRSGWTADMFVPGETITITGALDRFDPKSCYLSTALFADGTTADRYGQLGRVTQAAAPTGRAARLPGGEPNITGDWAPEQIVMTDPRGRGGALVPLSIVDQFEPGEGSIASPAAITPPEAAPDARPLPWRTRGVELTALGQQRAEGFGVYTIDNPRMRCETTSILFDWTFDGPVNRITQHDDRIVIEYGQHGFTRIVHMRLDAHPADIVPSRGGFSIGHWENDVLIVDTRGFEAGILSPPVFHSGQLHVVERFALDPDSMALTRSYSAVDPVYFVGSYEGSDVVYPADLPFAPDPCTELTFIDYSEVGRPATVPAGTSDSVPPWWRFRR